MLRPAKALATYNQRIFHLISADCAYEVSTNGVSFHVALANVVGVIQFGSKAQERLYSAPWDDALLGLPYAADDADGYFRGGRVIMANRQ
jgi:hypothetical protein